MSRSLAGGAGRVDWCPEQQALISWVRSSLCQKHGGMEANAQHSHSQCHTESKKQYKRHMFLFVHSHCLLIFYLLKIGHKFVLIGLE